MRTFLFATCSILTLLNIMGWRSTTNNEWKNKVDQSLLQKANDQHTVDFILVFKAQADLSKAKTLGTKEEKGTYVFQQLKKTADQSQKNIRSFLDQRQHDYKPFLIANAIYTSGNLSLIRALATYPEVKYVADNPVVKLPDPPTEETVTPRGSGTPTWGIDTIGADEVWDLGITGQGVVIGGQDTGYEWDHPAIKEQYRGWNGSIPNHNYNWHDAITSMINPDGNNNPCGYSLLVPCDDNSHGTHTMGTMAGGEGQNLDIGVAPGAKWIGCRNMDRGHGTPATYMDCFEFFLAPTNLNNENPDPTRAPHVINNSWSCPTSEGCNASNFELMETVINNLKTAGVVVVVSAGNNGPDCSSVNAPPSIFENSFAVGAANVTDTIASWSSRGPVQVTGSGILKPNVVAPGVGTFSAVLNGQYGTKSGTSMAGPHTAGAVALIISAKPEIAGQVDYIEDLLEQTAVQLEAGQSCDPFVGSNIPNTTYGYGRIDVLRAVQVVLEPVTKTEEAHLEGTAFQLSPNPFTSSFFLSSENLEGAINFRLFTLDGQLVKEENHYLVKRAPLEIHTNYLARGIYFYQITHNNDIFAGKLIKQ